MYLQPYPATWPKPGSGQPGSLTSRATHDELLDLFNRRMTTRAFAAHHKVSEKWASSLYTGKRELLQKQAKRKARQSMREFYALLVLKGTSVSDAADLACCSYSTMRRVVLSVTNSKNLGDL